MAFTFTFLHVIVVSDLKKNIGESTDLEKNRHGSADMHTLFTPLLKPEFYPSSIYDNSE